MLKLAIIPESNEFFKDSISRLDQLLVAQERRSRLISIADNKELLISSKGKVQANGFSYITTALAETCRAACPGLWKLVNDLSGIYNSTPPDQVQVNAAISTFNAVVGARFSERLYGRTVVANDDSHTYEGILGPSYQHLPNLNLFDILRQVSDGFGADLCYAMTVGRRIRFVFCWPIKVSVSYLDSVFSYNPGFSITNDETGEAAVRGQPIWFNSESNLICPRLERYERIIHTGKGFNRKLTTALHRLAVEPSRKEFIEFESCLLKMCKSKLNLSSEDVYGEGERSKKIIRFLIKCGLTRMLSSRILELTCRQGVSSKVKRGTETLLTGIMQNRHVFDLFITILREAKALSLQHREQAEKSAFNVLKSYGYRI